MSGYSIQEEEVYIGREIDYSHPQTHRKQIDSHSLAVVIDQALAPGTHVAETQFLGQVCAGQWEVCVDVEPMLIVPGTHGLVTLAVLHASTGGTVPETEQVIIEYAQSLNSLAIRP